MDDGTNTGDAFCHWEWGIVNVLVIGASGGTGRELIAQGAARGHAMTAFVRNPASFPTDSANPRITRGDVQIAAEVDDAIDGQEAVMCALGAKSLLARDPALIIGVHNIIGAMERASVPRLIYLSQLAVHAVRKQLNLLSRYVIAPLVLRNAAADHEINEAMIEQSQLAWTIVRPPKLTDGPRTGDYRNGMAVEARALVPKISRSDLAEFMLNQLDNDSYLHRTPTVMY